MKMIALDILLNGDSLSGQKVYNSLDLGLPKRAKPCFLYSFSQFLLVLSHGATETG